MGFHGLFREFFSFERVYALLRGQASRTEESAEGKADKPAALLSSGNAPESLHAETGTRQVDDLLDRVFKGARALVPEVFEPAAVQNISTEDALKRRFAVAVPLLAALMLGAPDDERRQQLLEGFLERLKIALREATVGDAGIGRRIKMFAAAANGRIQRYGPLLVAKDRAGLLTALHDHEVVAAERIADALTRH